MDVFPAGRGSVAIETKHGKVGITTVDKFGNSLVAYVEQDVAEMVAAAIQRAAAAASTEGRPA